jgi:hypothetical protein
MSDEVEIRKLSVSEVLKVQKLVAKSTKSKSESAQIDLLKDVIRLAVIDAETLTDDDFNTFPIGELNELSEEILDYSGLSGGPKQGN